MLYLEIIKQLQQFGTVLTEHLGDPNLSSYGEVQLPDQKIYQRDADWVRSCDMVVAEVTQASLGVGYELGLAESCNKKVFCLYRPRPDKRLSAMITGNRNFTIIEYQTVEDLLPQLKQQITN